MGKKNITFDDIAKYTNFSKTTISRYFNNPDSLTLKNQAIIATALEELDYHENKLARGLASGKTEIVGVMLPNMQMHYYQEVLFQLLSTYSTHGYKFMPIIGNTDPDKEREYIDVLLSHKIEGLITLSPTLSSEELLSYKIPIVSIEREDRAICSVNTNNYKGGYEAAQLLWNKGCDVLVHINDIDIASEGPCYQRVVAFSDFCSTHHAPHEVVIRNLGQTYSEQRNSIAEIVEEIEAKYPKERIGFFISNDSYANILLKYLLHRNQSLSLFPKFQIVGFDGSPISEEAILPITTIAQRIDLIASEAMELLIPQIKEQRKRNPKPLEQPIHKMVTPVLIERNTTM